MLRVGLVTGRLMVSARDRLLDERVSYESMKARLADEDDVDVDRYSEDKMPWIRAALARAERWATGTGWAP